MYLFIQKLCGEVEQENEEGFDNIVKKNNSIVKLDPWYAAIINKIRKEIPGELNSLRWIFRGFNNHVIFFPSYKI